MEPKSNPWFDSLGNGYLYAITRSQTFSRYHPKLEIKIGITNNPKRRFRELSYFIPNFLFNCGQYVNALLLERSIHKHLRLSGRHESFNEEFVFEPKEVPEIPELVITISQSVLGIEVAQIAINP